MLKSVKKRDGRVVLYDDAKIAGAILKALQAAKEGDAQDAARIAQSVQQSLEKQCESEPPQIEQIQDTVELEMMRAGFEEAAKQYILYRAQRTRMREANMSLMRSIDEITMADARISDIKRDNANIDGNTAMGSMLQIGTAGAKAYNILNLLTPEQAKAHSEGDIHIHDFDFYALTTTCCQIDLLKLFKGGFSTGHGYLREPQSIASYAALAAIAIQSNQNDQHGGQGVPNFDYAMAQGVAKTFEKQYLQCLNESLEDAQNTEDESLLAKAAIEYACNKTNESRVRMEVKQQQFDGEVTDYIKNNTDIENIECERIVKNVRRRAIKHTEKQTMQAMEGFVHNLNTMHSRAGAQTPFSSINYGTDTSAEGRLAIKAVLIATKRGLGHGETAIFPIHIFKVKEGVNYNEEDPNYDLFKLSFEVSAKRLFPNYLFLDSPFNKQYYEAGKPETEVATMGCRTRVMANVAHSNSEISYGRGNLSFTSINLVRLAIKAKGNEKLFYEMLTEKMKLVTDQIRDRFELQGKKRVYNYPFLMGQGVWLDSEKLGPQDEVRDVLVHGSLSMGFIGLAETLVALYGKHHGESDEMQQKGVEIVKFMREYCDERGKREGLNFSLLATPAEGLSGRFVKMDKNLYGEIKGVTDKEYYTNSFHIPVSYDITAYDKIYKEAPYHALTNAGHISYVELNGDTANNLEAFESIVRCMHDAGIGYGSINHPVDRDPVCGYIGIIGDVCPRCGRRAGEAVPDEKMEELKKLYPELRYS